jgi:hypothetical protein
VAHLHPPFRLRGRGEQLVLKRALHKVNHLLIQASTILLGALLQAVEQLLGDVA